MTAAAFTRLFILLFLMSTAPVCSAQKFELLPEASYLQVNGSSTLHDWEMQAEEMHAGLTAQFSDQQLQDISALKLQVKAQSLRGSKEDMNEDAHEALKTSRYEDITYEFQSLENFSCNNSTCTARLNGYLTVAGTRKPVPVDIRIETTGDRIKISGVKQLKMTYFDIEPPKTFLGLIKADEKVEVVFELSFEQVK